MKKFIHLVFFLGLALIFGGVAANAQAVTNVDAKISFDFVVRGKTLPAGNYNFALQTRLAAFSARNSRSGTRYSFHDTDVYKRDCNRIRAELIFDRVSGRAVLAKIVTPQAGYSLPKSESAKLVARDGDHKSKAVRN